MKAQPIIIAHKMVCLECKGVGRFEIRTPLMDTQRVWGGGDVPRPFKTVDRICRSCKGHGDIIRTGWFGIKCNSCREHQICDCIDGVRPLTEIGMKELRVVTNDFANGMDDISIGNNQVIQFVEGK